MAKYRITIEYPVEDSAITVEEEVNHWKEGGIDVPTINDADEICTVTGVVVE